MRSLIFGLILLSIIGLSGFFAYTGWQERQEQAESEKKAQQARNPENPLVIRSVTGNKITIEIANNKEGRKLNKTLDDPKSGAIIWRCLGAENTKEKGVTVVNTSLILGGPVAWDGNQTGVFEDQKRKMHVPANLCNIQAASGAYDLKPVNGVAIKDGRWANFVRIYLTELFKYGYGAVFPSGNINEIDIHTIPASTQAKKLQGFEVGSNLQCAIDGGQKVIGYKVRVAKSAKEIPGECEMLVFNNGKRTVWALRGPVEDNLVVRHEF